MCTDTLDYIIHTYIIHIHILKYMCTDILAYIHTYIHVHILKYMCTHILAYIHKILLHWVSFLENVNAEEHNPFFS